MHSYAAYRFSRAYDKIENDVLLRKDNCYEVQVVL